MTASWTNLDGIPIEYQPWIPIIFLTLFIGLFLILRFFSRKVSKSRKSPSRIHPLEIAILLLVSLALIALLIPQFLKRIPHTVTFFDASTEESLSNVRMDIIYDSFDISSPATGPETIFSGTTDNNGSITLHGHKASDFRPWQNGNKMYEYTVTIDGESFNQVEIREGNDSVYLLLNTDNNDTAELIVNSSQEQEGSDDVETAYKKTNAWRSQDGFFYFETPSEWIWPSVAGTNSFTQITPFIDGVDASDDIYDLGLMIVTIDRYSEDLLANDVSTRNLFIAYHRAVGGSEIQELKDPFIETISGREFLCFTSANPLGALDCYGETEERFIYIAIIPECELFHCDYTFDREYNGGTFDYLTPVLNSLIINATPEQLKRATNVPNVEKTGQ